MCARVFVCACFVQRATDVDMNTYTHTRTHTRTHTVSDEVLWIYRLKVAYIICSWAAAPMGGLTVGWRMVLCELCKCIWIEAAVARVENGKCYNYAHEM